MGANKHFGLRNYSNFLVTWHGGHNCHGLKNHQFQVDHKNLGKRSNILIFPWRYLPLGMKLEREVKRFNFLETDFV